MCTYILKKNLEFRQRKPRQVDASIKTRLPAAERRHGTRRTEQRVTLMERESEVALAACIIKGFAD